MGGCGCCCGDGRGVTVATMAMVDNFGSLIEFGCGCAILFIVGISTIIQISTCHALSKKPPSLFLRDEVRR